MACQKLFVFNLFTVVIDFTQFYPSGSPLMQLSRHEPTLCFLIVFISPVVVVLVHSYLYKSIL
jgi:hypothetical protein